MKEKSFGMFMLVQAFDSQMQNSTVKNTIDLNKFKGVYMCQ